MKKVGTHLADFLKNTCAIAVGVALLFYLFALILGKGALGIPFSQFALLLGFSVLLNAAGYLFRLRVSKFTAFLLHYLTCGVCFFVVFLAAGKIRLEKTADFFIALVLFTLIYAVVFGAGALIKHFLRKKDGESGTKGKAEEEYRKRF